VTRQGRFGKRSVLKEQQTKVPEDMALGNQWYCTLPQLAYTSTSTYHIEFMIVTFVQQVYMNQKAV